MLEKLSFEIKNTPVLYGVDGNPMQSPSHKVLYRSDNNKELSVMKNSYTPLLNQHFMETTERMSEISGFKIEGYSEFKGGSVVLSHLKNNEKDVVIGGRDIQDYLLLGSSCDGRYPFFLGTSTFIPFCQNQFSRITKMEKIRHTQSAPRKIEELLQTLELYFKSREEMFNNFEKMTQYEIDAESKQLAIEYILQLNREELLDGSISTRKLNQAEQLDLAMSNEMGSVGHNMWGLFNGITQFTSHQITQKESVFGNVFGRAADLNKRAYEFATAPLS